MQTPTMVRAAYDQVGQYDQDRINGFNDSFLDHFVSLAGLRGGEHVLDAMAGNGNLSQRLFNICDAVGQELPQITVLEYSKEQLSFAAATLRGRPARMFWGDILTMRSLQSGEELESGLFDTVMVKSSNHEIPLRFQQTMYDNIFRVLRPGGRFINLGFLFEEEEERDEFREIARTKDRLAGMESAMRNRHFLTRRELYCSLMQSGFAKVEGRGSFEYTIRTSEVARQYFSGALQAYSSTEHQVAQIRATTMRRKGLIAFTQDDSEMRCPGEITVAYKPSLGTGAVTYESSH